MKFSVGLPKNNQKFVNCILENVSHICEVYFSWGDFPNGRSGFNATDGCTYEQYLASQKETLKALSDANIPLNLLFNADCYGKDSQSRAFFHKIGETVDFIGTHYGLQSVTTTSPLIAKFIKENFKEIETRASVNMEIGTVQGMAYLAEYFDGYYMKRELNRDFESIKVLYGWCKQSGKQLFMLANSGCLNFCSAHHFHDNLVAHEAEIAQMDNAYHFGGVCRDYLKKEENLKNLWQNTNFVRPEDIPKYEPYFKAVKLATRVHKSPEMVLKSYIRGKYSGDLLQLLEPAHSLFPYVLENGEPTRLLKIDGMF